MVRNVMTGDLLRQSPVTRKRTYPMSILAPYALKWILTMPLQVGADRSVSSISIFLNIPVCG